LELYHDNVDLANTANQIEKNRDQQKAADDDKGAEIHGNGMDTKKANLQNTDVDMRRNRVAKCPALFPSLFH
jgi:hypothetical protein